jgi:ubiquinone biosynthesis protein
VLRSARALWLFWTILASYGLYWLLARLMGRERLSGYLEALNRRNARRLLRGFVQLGGVYIKVGQVLSAVGTFLPPVFGELLEELQDKVPPRPFREVEGRLRAGLGPAPLGRFQSFEQEPIAAASLAQVHRAITATGQPVAVKILYPGIEQLIRRDLAVLRSVLPVVERVVGVAHLDRILEQLGGMLARETDYANERRNMERIRAMFAGRPEIVVPEVVDELTGPGVLTMTLQSGHKITDLAALQADGIDAGAVARLLVDAYMSMLFEHRVFHADPHPGNFLVRPGPELVVLDYGAVEAVTDQLAEGLKLVAIGAVTKNEEAVLAGVERMGFVAPHGDRALLGRVGHEYLRALSEVNITDFSHLDLTTLQKLAGYQQIKGQLRAIMKSVVYPDGYFYLERTLVLLFGLVAQLAPQEGLPGLALPYATRALARQSWLRPVEPNAGA